MFCFLIETQKILLDYLVKMHDQFLTDMNRHSKNAYEKQHRKIRKRQKKAVDNILDTSYALMDLPDEQPIYKKEILPPEEEEKLRDSIQALKIFKQLEERGYGDLLLARYPSLRKYFAEFIQLPFAVEQGSDDLMTAINMIRKLDSGELKKIPNDAPTAFVPKELRRALIDRDGNINRNAWELGLAFAIKDTFRSGDLYLPKSKQHVSFWDMMFNETSWLDIRETAYAELELPNQNEAKSKIIDHFNELADQANNRFESDSFANIENGKLRLKRDDKAYIPASVTNLQKVINASMPFIRIEQLLMEVDKLTGFSRHFIPVQEHGSRPKNFYKTLIAAIISQATNLGVVSMSASVEGVSVDMLRYVLNHYIREETINAASSAIVDLHHQMPLSSVHGKGTLSSSDGQRFKIRADSLLASYYPRYYGYYEKAIGIYTHMSDQYSVFNTKVISCSPREALYVLDGLLENNTILKIREHTTDTHGYTEIIFALCYLLGYYFMPRIRDLKDQQLYRIDKNGNYGVFAPLLNKTADIDIVEELWDPMIHVSHSLKERTASAHVIVQRLTNSFPSDRLSKEFTNLGRIIKTEYILRYLTDPELRRTVQLQLNKGEYRHRLPRWIFFANQGEFTTGDYEEIMNKASCLSLVSNAVLYWNTIKINDIVEGLRDQGESIDNELLSHISLLPYKHVLPNGTYFIEKD
jgi:TnpA family transposase